MLLKSRTCYSKLIDEAMKQNCFCVAGSKETINASKSIFSSVREILNQ